jgi:hypothetical protein
MHRPTPAVIVLLVFGAVCFAPLAFFARGARAAGTQSAVSITIERKERRHEGVRR